jgi:tRNA A37 N6-isopentenylltransferase MiaA
MSRVSYRVMLDGAPGTPPAFRQLDPGAIDTRRRDATVRAQAHLSKRQVRWLRNASSSGGVDPEDIVRAVVDLAMELEIDWTAVTRPTELRDAIRGSVLIRHTG